MKKRLATHLPLILLLFKIIIGSVKLCVDSHESQISNDDFNKTMRGLRDKKKKKIAFFFRESHVRRTRSKLIFGINETARTG